MKYKNDVQIGDTIHIYHMFGLEDWREFNDTEGVVTGFDDKVVCGSWGPDALYYDDDWAISEEV